MINLVGNKSLKKDIANRMGTYGGDFVRALSVCILRADPTNLEKLQSGFQTYIRQYHIDNWGRK